MAKSSSMISKTKLDWWIKNNKNVLLIGLHGCGKTYQVKEAFERHNLKWRYFSASTMDPWVDFIGVPKEKTENQIPKEFEILKELYSLDPQIAVEWVQKNWKMELKSAEKVVSHAVARKEGATYLDLVRPRDFADGDVEALFFDEYNRSPKKVRNAVMELIQFKSINGKKFPNLKIVWAAVNPSDREQQKYDVEDIDPAQMDRFHVIQNIAYKPSSEYFRAKYGQRIADAATQWWEELPATEKDVVSPRRLDYALEVYREKGDIRDIVPEIANVGKLATALSTGPITEKIDALMQSNSHEEARVFLTNENNYAAAMRYIEKNEGMISFFLPVLSKEKLGVLLSGNDKLANWIISSSGTVPVFAEVCREIIAANTDARTVNKIKRSLTENPELNKLFAETEAKAKRK